MGVGREDFEQTPPHPHRPENYGVLEDCVLGPGKGLVGVREPGPPHPGTPLAGSNVLAQAPPGGTPVAVGRPVSNYKGFGPKKS